MKALGTKQLKQKTYSMIDVPEEWRGVLGRLPRSFVGIIYGDSGNGKTEFTIRMVKALAQTEKAAWLSYEQEHGYDLQEAVNRNKMSEVGNKVTWINPLHGHDERKTLFEELVEYLEKTRTRLIVIDSVDYLRLSVEEYYELKRKFGSKKMLVFISHAVGRKPDTRVAQKIEYDGLFGIYVKNYIARPKKSRVGGVDDYIIWEKKAREREPSYFATKEQAQPKKRGRKPKNVKR